MRTALARPTTFMSPAPARMITFSTPEASMPAARSAE
jgi:hypothetical protein